MVGGTTLGIGLLLLLGLGAPASPQPGEPSPRLRRPDLSATSRATQPRVAPPLRHVPFRTRKLKSMRKPKASSKMAPPTADLRDPFRLAKRSKTSGPPRLPGTRSLAMADTRKSKRLRTELVDPFARQVATSVKARSEADLRNPFRAKTRTKTKARKKKPAAAPPRANRCAVATTADGVVMQRPRALRDRCEQTPPTGS